LRYKAALEPEKREEGQRHFGEKCQKTPPTKGRKRTKRDQRYKEGKRETSARWRGKSLVTIKNNRETKERNSEKVDKGKILW